MDEENLNNEPIEGEEQDIEESNIVTLKDEEGNDVNFEFLDLIEYEGENYVILLPADETEDEESDEVEESYISVDDEDTLNKVFDIFKEKFKDEFNFLED